jgi:hypothetical protein
LEEIAGGAEGRVRDVLADGVEELDVFGVGEGARGRRGEGGGVDLADDAFVREAIGCLLYTSDAADDIL